ncbi:hypothetical protein FVE85_5179 [Porphyridium purpureum]|uniref:Uncharacterized protein n=1 Tax=Porphyridium purpureum TaxID=35688 RepID=A0A5J4Z3T8_PORPP|nr:hypothetical protein FVE85_5179 [Porphyridium purpureum]|eukprot:POR5866..scf295_1
MQVLQTSWPGLYTAVYIRTLHGCIMGRVFYTYMMVYLCTLYQYILSAPPFMCSSRRKSCSVLSYIRTPKCIYVQYMGSLCSMHYIYVVVYILQVVVLYMSIKKYMCTISRIYVRLALYRYMDILYGNKVLIYGDHVRI